ncbi:MAG: hypothetical protein WBB28_20685 [Crinalium sp.]
MTYLVDNSYLRLTRLDDGNILLELEEHNITENEKADLLKKANIDAFAELFEWYLCNGWELVVPEQIGALVDDDAILISDNCYTDDNGDIETIDCIYYHPYSAITGETNTLLEEGKLVMIRFDLV